MERTQQPGRIHISDQTSHMPGVSSGFKQAMGTTPQSGWFEQSSDPVISGSNYAMPQLAGNFKRNLDLLQRQQQIQSTLVEDGKREMRSTTQKNRGKKKSKRSGLPEEDLADGYYLVHVANSSQVPSSLGFLRGGTANRQPTSGGMPSFSQAPSEAKRASQYQESSHPLSSGHNMTSQYVDAPPHHHASVTS